MNFLHTRFLDVDRPRESIALLLAFASLAVVGAAWSFEYFGFVPCRLCLIQRQPYYMAIPIALLAWGVERVAGPRWVTRLLLLALAGLYLWGGSVGFYQAGAEWGYWPGPADCAGGGTAIPTSASDLLGSLSKVKVVDCTKAQIRILGLSFAGWNVLASTGLVTAAVLGVLLPDRARR